MVDSYFLVLKLIIGHVVSRGYGIGNPTTQQAEKVMQKGRMESQPTVRELSGHYKGRCHGYEIFEVSEDSVSASTTA